MSKPPLYIWLPWLEGMADLESMVLVRLSISGSDSSSRIELKLPCLTSLVSRSNSTIELRLPCLLSRPKLVGVNGLSKVAGGSGSGFSRLFCRLKFRAWCEDWLGPETPDTEGAVGAAAGLSGVGVSVAVLEFEFEFELVVNTFKAPNLEGALVRLKESSRVGIAFFTPR